jgi:hypothetical protein
MRALALVVLFSASRLVADDLVDMERACLQRANVGFGKYWLMQCLEEVFTSDPSHLSIGTIAPGAGTLAVGPAFTEIPRINRTEMLLTGFALISTDTSWQFQTQAVFAMPAMGQLALKSAQTEAQRYSLHAHGLQYPSELDAKASITLQARLWDAKEQWFYGIGPATALSNESLYSQKQFDFTAGYNNPFSSWSSGGVNFEFIRPRIVDSNSGTQLASLYNNASAPGLDARDDFVRFEPYFTFKVPARRSWSNIARIGYSFYHALGDPRYSFQRLSASTVTTIPLNIPTGAGQIGTNRGPAANFFCPPSRSGAHCSAGTLSLIGRVDATYDSSASESPFFLDPTLGGSDLQGNDTLRGFGDYRFRAPDRVLLQAEYRHPVWSFIGLLSFYDVGKVGLEPSSLTLGQLRHDLGVGVYLSVANRELARIYVAFGTGEPVQVQAKFGSPF